MNTRSRRWWSILCCALLLPIASVPAHADSDLPMLSPDQAFRLTYADSGRAVRLHFHVAPGYTLYRDRVTVSDDTPKRAALAVMLPPGTIGYNAALGKTTETYDHDFDAEVNTPQARPFRIVVRIQGCADVGVCYPPVERVVTLTGR